MRYVWQQLTTETQPWPSTPGQKTPARTESVPALWAEYLGLGAKNILTSMKAVGVVDDIRALLDKNRLVSIGATADRERSVRHGLTGIHRDRRMKTEG